MRTKHPITEEPWFYERTQLVHSRHCSTCSEHKYIIVQKVGDYYTTHSFVGKSTQIRFLHRWSVRADDPICLLDFERRHPVPGWQPKPRLVATKVQMPAMSPDLAQYVDGLIAQHSLKPTAFAENVNIQFEESVPSTVAPSIKASKKLWAALHDPQPGDPSPTWGNSVPEPPMNDWEIEDLPANAFYDDEN